MKSPYRGEAYLDFLALEASCQALAQTFPDVVQLETIGYSRQGRPIYLLTIAAPGKVVPQERPAFWLDAGIHAAEWAGIMAALYAAWRWAEAAAQGEEWFSHHTLYLVPCISPDGFQALCEGAPFLRSVLRPPESGMAKVGFVPRDLDGDGRVLWMRWRHPAGPFVPDKDLPIHMRPRRLEDDPQDAYFLCPEGEFVSWDGVRWTAAIREYGLDLNRNFPENWRPLSMWGMDSGPYPLSEPESRAVIEAFAARPRIACALSCHTYTGCLLTAPARADDPLGQADLRLLESLAQEAVEGTGYRVIRKYPDFVYDSKNPIAGCWDDTLTNVFGVAAYVLELWDPCAYAGIDNPKPAEFFQRPDPERLRRLILAFVHEPGTKPWQAFDHPQLGPVEIGGLDYYRTIRNPPERLLAAECKRAFQVAETLRRALPRAEAKLEVESLGDLHRVRLVLENWGFLPTSGLALAETLPRARQGLAKLTLDGGLALRAGTEVVLLDSLDGWGALRVGVAANPLYAELPRRGVRMACEWLVQGVGEARIDWDLGRGGAGVLEISLGGGGKLADQDC
ncbi:MAG: M14 family metallopeptidase [Methylohalobius sp.]|nr:M14 family metallopeptidase [Methylohalobius sp.]